MLVRKAIETDLNAVAEIYNKIHTAEENGEVTIGWKRGIYPEKRTALEALKRDALFVMEYDGELVGTGIINQNQVDVYAEGKWKYQAPSSRVMVLHTLVIDPDKKRNGFGTAFVKFYEQFALKNGCRYLRMDTNEKNTNARRLYKALGYAEIGIIPCVFNGLEGVNLVLLEKYLKDVDLSNR